MHVVDASHSWFDRAVMVATSSVTATWRDAVLIVKPETILRSHREGFRLFWQWKTRTPKRQGRIGADGIAFNQDVGLDGARTPSVPR